MVKSVSPSGYYAGKEFFLKGRLPLRVLHMDHSIAYPIHSHDFTEVAVIYSGQAVHRTCEGDENVSAGNVLLIPVGMGHSYLGVKDFSYVNIIFDSEKLMRLPLSQEKLLPFKDYYDPHSISRMELSGYQIKALLSLVNKVDRELFRNNTVSPMLTVSYFLQFLSLLYESANQSRQGNLPADERIRNVIEGIDACAPDDCSIKNLSSRSATSPRNFYRLFKKIYGKSPSSYINERRIDFSCELLRDTDLTVTQIASLSGFDDPNYYSHLFRQMKGVSPSVFRNHDRRNLKRES